MILVKIKLFIINISFYFQILYNPLLLKTDIINDYLIKENRVYQEQFLNLKEKKNDNNDSTIIEKKHILNFISKTIKKKVSSVKKIIFTKGTKFGNNLICLNKLIYFCEIIGCKEIELTSKTFWFIKKPILLKDYNITINKKIDNQKISVKNNTNSYFNTIYYDSFNIFAYFYKIKPKISIQPLRDEIINNLPKINISRKDLYVHLRGGDIFKNYINKPYAQPPLCFYISIFRNFNFRKIFLISEDQSNPNFIKLSNKFKNIIYSKNSLKYDLSCLMNSYNLVGSISSFLNSIIILNTKLLNLWDYNIYQMEQKLRQQHYDLFQYPHSFTIYRMEASTNYKKKMYIWKNSRAQRKLMIKEKCINSFIIKRNI